MVDLFMLKRSARSAFVTVDRSFPSVFKRASIKIRNFRV